MMGRMWMIPKEAKKPEDPRKTKKNKSSTLNEKVTARTY